MSSVKRSYLSSRACREIQRKRNFLTIMKTILTTLNAKNVHKALAPWLLKSYADERGIFDITIIEANINEQMGDIVHRIYSQNPSIIGFGIYIWNTHQTAQLAKLLKKLLPNLYIIVGGPEVQSHTLDNFDYADHKIIGAGEAPFYEKLTVILSEFEGSPASKKPNTENHLTPEYFNSFKTDQIPQIQNRLIYYESARGCPYSCAYCMSAKDKELTFKPLQKVFEELTLLVVNGAKIIKFVDRTFNADKKRTEQIFEFLSTLDTDATFHFELVAEHLTERAFKLISALPKNRVQFEVGVQSLHAPTLKAINRTQNNDKLLANIKRLASLGNCHVHVDLIAMLPHETLATFATGFNQLFATRPHHIQLGFLKLLPSTPLEKSALTYGIIADTAPPYEVYQTNTMSFEDKKTLKNIEGAVKKFYNSGKFHNEIMPLIEKTSQSPFDFFKTLANLCIAKGYPTFNISPKNAITLLSEFDSK